MSNRMYSTITNLIGALVPLIVGCAAGSGRSECPVARNPAASAAIPAASATPSVAPSASAPAVAVAPAPASAATATPAEAVPASTTPAQSLPELKIQLSGMHIGGGPNDEVTKRPFIQAIEASFDALRTCYKKAEDPARGGTFGVDLKIAHHGGKPELQQVRTALKGEGLRECLEAAFKEISFAAPPKGPTVVSVSVRFTLGE